MPCEFFIDPERRLVVSRGTGVFRYGDFLEHLAGVGRDPRFDAGFDHVVDCRGFNEIDLSLAQLQQIGARSLFASSSRRVLVVASDLHYGLAKMFSAFRFGSHRQVTKVFREMQEATAWLGLPADYEAGGMDKSNG